MKKFTPYLLALLVITAIVLLFVTGNNSKGRRFDDRVTLRRQDKIPYGTHVAFNSLPAFFPGATILISRQEPGYWDSLSSFESGQAYIVIADRFSADELEMNRLIAFARNGNDVLISAQYISGAADKIFGCNSSAYDLSLVSMEDLGNNMTLTLNDPPFQGGNASFTYPGKTFNSYFSELDTATSNILGKFKSGRSYFIHLRAGTGNFYVHLEPLAFSNYFLLHKNNMQYYEKVMSLIQPGVRKVLWDEYYRYKSRRDRPDDKKKGWFNVFMKHPAFRAALLTAIATLLIYVLAEMRRRQRYIPVITKPRNDSLDFVKTIGRLYFDKGDHLNLSRKMSTYFLEHVRNKYTLSTGVLDEEFIKNLQYKSGVEEKDVRGIVSFIKYLDTATMVTAGQVSGFHQQLEIFYKKV